MFSGMGKHWRGGFCANAWGVGYALRNARKAARAHKRIHRSENIRQTDYKDEVAKTAGEIHRLLAGGGEVRLNELQEGAKHKGGVFWAALGWLMREDNIELRAQKQGLTVRLRV
jgi:hypothetical protein